MQGRMRLFGWGGSPLFMCIFGVLSCGGSESAPLPPIPVVEDSVVLADPQTLYEACRGLVENPELPGECETDADCSTAGCSGEVCMSGAAEAPLTTCVVMPCFRVLDKCGCMEGYCRWDVRAPGVLTSPGTESPE